MAVTNYLTVDGEIIGETTNGARRHYLTDALGSVTATVAANATVENTYRYKPSGERLSTTGTATDPAFLWLGSLGYRTGRNGVYVRARHYQPRTGMWTTQDALWPQEPAYGYAGESFVSAADPTGRWRWYREYDDKWRNTIWWALPWAVQQDFQEVLDCVSQAQGCEGYKEYPPTVYSRLRALAEDPSERLRFLSEEVTKTLLTVRVSKGRPCNDGRVCGYTIIQAGKDPVIVICEGAINGKFKCPPLRCTLVHELIHAAGVMAGREVLDCVKKMAGCENMASKAM